MSKNVFALFAALIAAGSIAHAETMVEDTDGNGTYSIEELMVAYPAMTAEDFAAVDTDADGAVSPEELSAAVEAGVVAE
ncbi:EF-hand domain-containing protein [Tropicibacter oceani]|uniref:EF-hand domain-containing protein n=1 Tax=Tropicibacter oceani TaxID=3058420 RepID=A0ABY8QHI9_9RHOB|nr:EF-hand domain-containing protein [Tropicibacter oceani]WGW03267.1 EF-hand domain-containing protein [Tropicibacter oceani]